MQPKVEIMYNYEYAQKLYRGTGNFKDVWGRIIGQGARFEQLYDQCSASLLAAIEKYSGFAWGERSDTSFPIYLAEVETSFAHPLTLAVREDPVAMLQDIVYQLVHRNMYFGFKSDELRDLCLQSVASAVLEGLELGTEEDNLIKVKEQTIKQYLQ